MVGDPRRDAAGEAHIRSGFRGVSPLPGEELRPEPPRVRQVIEGEFDGRVHAAALTVTVCPVRIG